MRPQIVYLAGPITGLNYAKAMEWRIHATNFLHSLRNPEDGLPKYEVLSPLRGKAFLDSGAPIAAVDLPSIAHDQWVFRRDKWDVERCDIALFNLLDSEGIDRVSVGTTFEMAWAEDKGKFSLIVATKNNPHWHSFVRQSASLIVPTLDKALKYMDEVLNTTGCKGITADI